MSTPSKRLPANVSQAGIHLGSLSPNVNALKSARPRAQLTAASPRAFLMSLWRVKRRTVREWTRAQVKAAGRLSCGTKGCREFKKGMCPSFKALRSRATTDHNVNKGPPWCVP